MLREAGDGDAIASPAGGFAACSRSATLSFFFLRAALL